MHACSKNIEMLLLQLSDKCVLTIFCFRPLTSDLTIIILINMIFMLLVRRYINGTYIYIYKTSYFDILEFTKSILFALSLAIFGV